MKAYPITPMGKPRMTQRDKHRPVHKRYFKFKDDVKALGIEFPEHGAHITFTMPMPKSWSKKKKATTVGLPHQQKPDLDNLMKALGDAVYQDDSGIWDVRITKVWGYNGAIKIRG